MDDQRTREIFLKDRIRNAENVENLLSMVPCKYIQFVIEAQRFLEDIKKPYQQELKDLYPPKEK